MLKRFLLGACFSFLIGCGEAPYVFYKYSGTVRDGASNPVASVLVTVTDRNDHTKVLAANRSENVTSTTTDSSGKYVVQVGFRGDWQGALVFNKSGFSESAFDISSDGNSHEEDDVVEATVDPTLFGDDRDKEDRDVSSSLDSLHR